MLRETLTLTEEMNDLEICVSVYLVIKPHIFCSNYYCHANIVDISIIIKNRFRNRFTPVP